MRTAVCLVFIAIGLQVGLTSSAAPVPKDDPKAKVAAELEAMAGVWEVESATLGGRAFPTGDARVRYEIKGSVMQTVGTEGKWELTLDPAAVPKRMTQTELDRVENGVPFPKDGGQVNRCVYELKGDTLTYVIWRGKDSIFPPSVTPAKGAPVMVMVLKRVKDKK